VGVAGDVGVTAQTIAQAKVRIRPDFTGFKQESDAEVDKATARGGTVKITADTAEAKAKADELRLRLDALSSKVATAKVDLDGDQRAQDRLTRLEFQLRRVGLTTARPNVNLQGVARANLQLDELEAKLAAVGRRGGGGGRGIFGGGSGGGGGLPNPSGGLLALAGLAPTAIPLTGAALGLGAGLLTPTAAGLTGLVPFALAARSTVTQTEKDMKQLQTLRQRIANTPATTAAGSPAQIAAAQARLRAAEANLQRAQYVGGTARVASAQAGVSSAQAALARVQGGAANPAHARLLKQEQDLLKSMTPEQRAAAKSLDRLDDAWKHFQKDLAPQTLKVLADAAAVGAKGLALLAPSAKATGAEVDHLTKLVKVAANEPFWHQFFGEFMGTEAPRAVDALGRTIGNLLTAGAHLAEDFAPLGHDFESGMVRLSGRFESWTEGQGPGKFVAWVEREGPLVGRTLGDLATAIEGIGRGLAPIGQVELAALGPVLKFIGDLGNEHPAIITALGAALLTVGVGLKGIAAVKGLGGVIGKIPGLGGKSGGGGVLGALEGRGSPTNPLYVIVLDKNPIPKSPSGPSPLSKLLPFIPKALPYTLPLLTSGDTAPGQNGPPLSQRKDIYSRLFTILDPTGKRDFPRSDYPNNKLSVSAAVDTLYASGTPAQLKQLQALGKSDPAVASELAALAKSQQDLTHLLTNGQPTYVLNNPTFSGVANVHEFERQLQRNAQQARRRRALSGGSSRMRFE
jgi:hypothetical protein